MIANHDWKIQKIHQTWSNLDHIIGYKIEFQVRAKTICEKIILTPNNTIFNPFLTMVKCESCVLEHNSTP